jgi:hypothetical protein
MLFKNIDTKKEAQKDVKKHVWHENISQKTPWKYAEQH